MDLTFDLLKMRRYSKNQEKCTEAVLNDLINQVSHLSDDWTGSGDSAEIIAKTIAAVRGVEVFAPVYLNPSKTVRQPESSLRSCALEANRLTLKNGADARSLTSTACKDRIFHDTAEDLYREFLVDHRLRRKEKGIRRRFKGYGDGLAPP